jgi:pyruvate formate lyase activating enzyme
MTGIVFDIKECALHDGEGLRTTVFLKGCPLRCIWCHNPEGFDKRPNLLVKPTLCQKCGLCQRGCDHEECRPYDRCLHVCPVGAISLTGKEYEARALAKHLMKNKVFFDASGGGVTFSGGEPLMQHAFLIEVASYLDTHIAIETSGYASEEVFRAVLDGVDTVIMDLKLADDAKHQRFTGVSNRQILKNAELLKRSGKKHVFRTPLIPHVTDTKENLSAIQKIVGTSPWEKIPYNNMAAFKYPMMGMEFEYDNYIRENKHES